MRQDTFESRPTLSVVVPVFNQASSIVGNLGVIRERVLATLRDGETMEIVVVSDGSIDATEAALVAQGHGSFRVFHYDRNLGKGYAVKLGALEATGDWVGFVDADLDLDPSALGIYLHSAQEHHLDFAIGSKRHPDSQVHYPPARVVTSWLFQQLVRVLFRLHVRDTQVGLKLFNRAVAEQVLPLLLVKRYAFDIELLAVARAFGFDRVEEMPVRLDYRFAGSGVTSRAVIRALVDTAAIFYRLRILRYYQRRRAISGAYGWTRPREHHPLVSILLPPNTVFREREYPAVEIVDVAGDDLSAIRAAAQAARGDVLALLQPEGRASGNLLSATVPFFARPEIAAVVFPRVAPLGGPTRLRAAAAIDESRMGAGFGYFRHTPGNIRFVRDFPAANIVVRRDEFLALPEETPVGEVVSALAARDVRVLYTPDAVVVADPPPLFAPHLAAVLDRGRSWGRRVRLRRPGQIELSRLLLFLTGFAAAVIVALELGGAWHDAVVGVIAVYALASLGAAAAASIRHQSLVVGGLVLCGIPCTHAAFLVGAARGLLRL